MHNEESLDDSVEGCARTVHESEASHHREVGSVQCLEYFRGQHVADSAGIFASCCNGTGHG